MPLKRQSQTRMHTHTQAHTVHTDVICVRISALTLFVLASLAAAPECVCSFHWLPSTPPNPWEFVDQQLLKKLLGVGVCNSAKTECNECNQAVMFMWYLWCVLFAIVYGGGWRGDKSGARPAVTSPRRQPDTGEADRAQCFWNAEGIVACRHFMVTHWCQQFFYFSIIL